jgi:hypothetical protein
VSFTRVGDVFTIVRGQEGTTAKEHDQDDRFQLCLQYSADDPADIWNDLLINYTGINSSLIPLADWQTETTTYNGRVYGAVITEPTPVVQLVNELLEQAATSMWWDDLAQLIRIRVLRGVDVNATEYGRSVILLNSFNAKDQPNKRVSQVWTYYGQKDPTKKLDERNNYRSTLATIDPDSETNHNSEPSVKEIFSRWIPAFSRDGAETLNKLILSRYAEPPRLLGFRLMRDSGIFEPEPAGGYKVSDLMLQDATGAPAIVDVQAVSVKPANDFITVTAEEVLYSQTIAPPDPTIKPITIGFNKNNINLRSIFNDTWGSADSGDTVNVTIESGVIIGSTSTGAYAFDTGTWPAGITINIVNNGRIQGRGGKGGNGANIKAAAQDGFNGEDGGNAILVRYDIDLDNTDGEIFAGGGGGGGGGSYPTIIGTPFGPLDVYVPGAGGGGGAGTVDAPGGQGGSNNVGERSGDGNSGTKDAGGLGGNSFLYSIKSGGDGGGIALLGSTGVKPASGGDGGSGGLPGDAIVQSGGTVTISGAGDIRGAIV